MRWCAALTTGLTLLLAGCGYHVSGHADLLPKSIKTIAVPAFTNPTTRYRLTERLPAAITREFLARTRYDVVADPSQADAVLQGNVLSYAAFPTTFDPRTGRASAVQIYVHLQLTLRDRAGNVLFSRPDFEARERYEISTDQRAYLEESDPALDRLSRYVARMVVSAVLENF
jgi:outer membrane lipopolysaccharide assembly protein LptE/RlpB